MYESTHIRWPLTSAGQAGRSCADRPVKIESMEVVLLYLFQSTRSDCVVIVVSFEYEYMRQLYSIKVKAAGTLFMRHNSVSWHSANVNSSAKITQYHTRRMCTDIFCTGYVRVFFRNAHLNAFREGNIRHTGVGQHARKYDYKILLVKRPSRRLYARKFQTGVVNFCLYFRWR